MRDWDVFFETHSEPDVIGPAHETFLRRFTPNWVRRLAAELLTDRSYNNLSTREVFTKIYGSGEWDRTRQDAFCSGEGSRDKEVSSSYVSAVSNFLEFNVAKMDGVDLGCGDFQVGSRIRPYCRRYVACDIVPSLIDYNNQMYSGDFRCLDICSDPLPQGDVAFLRQVLQHLSNEKIEQVCRKLPEYKFVIVTEHLPKTPSFLPNVDKPTGPTIRLGRANSGVVLTAPPFYLQVTRTAILNRIRHDGGIVQTTLYQM